VKQANILYILLALLALNAGQMISGLRMRYYFGTAGLALSRRFAIALYYIGMLFSLVLPGGIGGDGYKVYFIQKTHDFPWKTALRLILSGRASGLLLLVVFTLILGLFSPPLNSWPYTFIVLILGLILVFPAYSLLALLLLKEPLAVQMGAAKYSAMVQGLVLLTAMALLHALGHTEHIIDYVMLFMVSSVVSVIPVSIGGAGLRELTFFYGAAWFGLDQELGVTLSILYFFVNILASLPGLVFFYGIKGQNRKEQRSEG